MLTPGLYYKIKLPNQDRYGLVQSALVSLAPEAVRQDRGVRFDQLEQGLIKTVEKMYPEIPPSDFLDFMDVGKKTRVRQYVMVIGKLNPSVLQNPAATTYKQMDSIKGAYTWLPSNARVLELISKWQITSDQILGDKVEAEINAIKSKFSDGLKALGAGGKEIFDVLSKLLGGDKALWDKLGIVGTNLVTALQKGFGQFKTEFSIQNFAAKLISGNPEATFPKQFDVSKAGLLEWVNAGLGLLGLNTVEGVAFKIKSLLPAAYQNKAGILTKVMSYVKNVWDPQTGFAGGIALEVKALSSNFESIKAGFVNDIKTFAAQQIAYAI